jgi:hypothetical protein
MDDRGFAVGTDGVANDGGSGGVMIGAAGIRGDSVDGVSAAAGAAARARHVRHSLSDGGTSEPHFGQIHVNIAAFYCTVIFRNCSILARSSRVKQSS